MLTQYFLIKEGEGWKTHDGQPFVRSHLNMVKEKQYKVITSAKEIKLMNVNEENTEFTFFERMSYEDETGESGMENPVAPAELTSDGFAKITLMPSFYPYLRFVYRDRSKGWWEETLDSINEEVDNDSR